MNPKTKKVFQLMGFSIPLMFEDTGIKTAGLKQATSALKSAPQTGKLVVSGTASPMMVGFFEQGRKVAAINYFELFNAKFTDEPYELPPPRKNQVTLISEVGKEPVKNFEYSAKLLQGLIASYESLGIVIIETHLTPSTFNMQYGVNFTNKLIIPKKDEVVWT